ncbi:IS66 family transposase zinc-finger binding domain-containing protein, partial [Chryseomicrobium palamuruense]
MKTKLTIEELEKKNAELERRNRELQADIEYYKQKYALLTAQKFGTSSEKTDKEQLELQLFNEAEISSTVLLEEPTLETISYTRKKKIGRADRLNELPVETIHYDLSDSEKVCSECDHSMHEMSTQVRKELKIIPAQVKVVEHVQHIYSCRNCETHSIKTPIKKAEMPKPVIKKGLASPS